MIFDLVQDFADMLATMPSEQPRRRPLSLLNEALRRDVHFIEQHPTTLFQCLWNTCWWYDCPQAEQHYEPAETGPSPERGIGRQLGSTLSALLKTWREQKEAARSGSVWLRSLRPPLVPLGGPLRALFAGHSAAVKSLALSADGQRLASASADCSVRVWEMATQREIACLQGHAGVVRQAVLTAEGRRALSWSADGTVRLWDVAVGVPLACYGGPGPGVRCLQLSADAGLAVLVDETGALRTWQLLRGLPGCSIRDPEKTDRLIAVSDAGDLLAVASGSVIRLHEAASGNVLARLEGHGGVVTCMAFAPRGNRLVSGSEDCTVRVWDVEEGRVVICLQGHRSAVRAVAYSGDGDYIASGSEGEVHVWEEAYETDLVDLQDHDEAVHALAFVPKTAVLISGSASGTIRMYDLLEFSRIAEGRPLGGSVTVCAVSPDGRLFVCGAADGSWGVWTVEKGTRLMLFVPRPLAEIEPVSEAGRTVRPASGAAVLHVSFSPDGRHFWIGFADSRVQRWDVSDVVEYAETIQTGIQGNPSVSARFGVIPLTVSRPEPVVHPTRADDFEEVLLSPDANTFVSASPAAALRVWDATTGKILACLSDLPAAPSALAFAADGKWLAAGFPDGSVRWWQTRDQWAMISRNAQRGPIRHLTFSPDGDQLLSQAEGESPRLWKTSTGKRRRFWGDGAVATARAAWAPDRPLLALLQEDGSIRVGDGLTNEILARLAIEDSITDVLVPAGCRNVVARRGREIQVWNLAGGRPPYLLQRHTEPVTCLIATPDGSALLSGSEDATIRLWDLTAFSPVRRLRGSGSLVRCLAVTPDGAWVATGQDHDILLWDGGSGEMAAVLEGHSGNVRCLGFSRDGRWLASGSTDQTVRVWDVTRRAPVIVLEGHEGPVLSLAFAADGSRLVSGPGSRDSTVRLWDIGRGELIRTFEGHQGEILGVDISPDGRFIVSGSDDQTVRIWDADSGREVACFRVSELFVDAVAFISDGRRVVSGLSDVVVRVWDVASGECLERFEGHGDVRALADARPWLGRVQPTATVITSVPAGAMAAWFRGAMELLCTDIYGRVWAGVVGGHMCLLRLESSTGG